MKDAARKTSFNVFTTEQDKPLLLRSTLNWTTPDGGLAQYSYTHFIIKNLLIRKTRLKLTKYFYEKFQQKIKIRVVKIKSTESNAFTQIIEGVKVSRFSNKIRELRITEPQLWISDVNNAKNQWRARRMDSKRDLPLVKSIWAVRWCNFRVWKMWGNVRALCKKTKNW